MAIASTQDFFASPRISFEPAGSENLAFFCNFNLKLVKSGIFH